MESRRKCRRSGSCASTMLPTINVARPTAFSNHVRFTIDQRFSIVSSSILSSRSEKKPLYENYSCSLRPAIPHTFNSSINLKFSANVSISAKLSVSNTCFFNLCDNRLINHSYWQQFVLYQVTRVARSI